MLVLHCGAKILILGLVLVDLLQFQNGMQTLESPRKLLF